MGLYDRLIGLESPGIGVHGFIGVLGELERGKLTRADVIAWYALTAAEQAELDTLTAKMRALPESYPLGAFVTLTNVGATYDAIGAAKGLGFVAVDVQAITRLEIRIRYNKVGTGTLTWQLWNETDAQELGTVDDTVAGDNKTASIIVTPASPLSGGVKLLRVRVKSTVATDDPIYYGACLFLRRADRLTADDLHQVLLVAQNAEGGLYPTAAALKARLGV